MSDPIPSPLDVALHNPAAAVWPVVYKRLRQAKRLTLRLNPVKQHIVLTFPWRTPQREAEQFLKAQTAWLQEQIKLATPAHRIAIGEEIPVYGQMRRIVHVLGAARGIHVTLTADELQVSGKEERVPRAIYRYLKSLAATEIERLAAMKAQQVARPIRTLTLRDTSSRWGSCTSTGDLNFCWRLILAPIEVLDYVVGHEVAHLVHMHHKPSFWALCRTLTPYTTMGKNWLRQHGNSLQIVLPDVSTETV